jgi:N-acetylglucosamine-6-phosphate deacetylase
LGGVLTAAAVAVPEGDRLTVHRPGWLAIDGGRVTDAGQGSAPGALDLGDVVLAPGFVDIQVNGIHDVDFAVADADAWRRAGRVLLGHGVTSYCPTLVSAPLGTYGPTLERVAAARDDALARGLPSIAGAHLEGPFLGGAPGAHPLELLRLAQPEWLAARLDALPGVVRIVTLAPEADPMLAATRLLAERGVVVALGHSTAPYEDVLDAVDAGARVVTHLYNGMPPFHHRAPGLVGAALDDDRLTPSIIGDLVHVHPVALRLAIARKRNVALVTDAVAVPGRTAGLTWTEVDGAARLADGTLAGSMLTMDVGVRNLVSIGVRLDRALELAASVPARLLGLDTYAARVGGCADLVALDAATLAVRAVWLEGVQLRGPEVWRELS